MRSRSSPLPPSSSLHGLSLEATRISPASKPDQVLSTPELPTTPAGCRQHADRHPARRRSAAPARSCRFGVLQSRLATRPTPLRPHQEIQGRSANPASCRSAAPCFPDAAVVWPCFRYPRRLTRTRVRRTRPAPPGLAQKIRRLRDELIHLPANIREIAIDALDVLTATFQRLAAFLDVRPIERAVSQ